jgi:hypothetical protein
VCDELGALHTRKLGWVRVAKTDEIFSLEVLLGSRPALVESLRRLWGIVGRVWGISAAKSRSLGEQQTV